MKFYRFLLALMMINITAWAQENKYSFDLTLIDSSQTLSGRVEMLFYNSSPRNVDQVYIHFPSRALESKESFLHRQLADFQNINAFYSNEKKRGKLTVQHLQTDSAPRESCEDCEYLPIPLQFPIGPGDSMTISMDFDLKLGSSEFNGAGYDGEMYRIVDWLPRFPTLDSNGFKLYPVTFQRDESPALNTYELKLTLPEDMLVASNAELNTSSERALIDSLKQLPLQKPAPSNKLKTLDFSHRGTNLQLFISRELYVYPMDNGGTLYTTDDELFIPYQFNEINKKITAFFNKEIGKNEEEQFDLILLDDKNGEYQSDGLLTLEIPNNLFKFSRELCHARAEMVFRYKMRPDGFQNPWLARGIPYFYKYSFINEYWPDEKWLPLSNSILGRFFALDQFDYSYQNQFLYLYLARQNLDQKMSEPVDSLSRLNYEAIVQAKVYMSLSHLQGYVSPYTFSRSMRRFYVNHQGSANAHNLQKSFEFFVNRPVEWFFKDWVNSTATFDYRLVKTDHCPTVSTATVVNTGTLTIPFSLTGFKDGEPVLTEWFQGHEGRKNLQMYHAEYDKVVLNYPGRSPEFNQRNNVYYNRLLLPRTEPLRLQFYYSFEDPQHSQLFWTPTFNYNAYDKLLLGISLDNSSLVQKRFEYIIGPEYSTGTGRLTGYSSFIYNWLTPKSPWFHQVRMGVFGRYYHYDRDLTYLRLSPAINFYFRKPYPTSSILQNLRFRLVNLMRELPDNFSEPANEVGNSSFSVLNVTYKFEETDIFHPMVIQTDFYWGDQFSRLSVEGDFRLMLPNKKWAIWRHYGGYFFTNKFANNGITDNYYSLGLSGTQDFLFDYSFFGRSETSGIWSQQTFITEGGFKSQTNTFSDEWMWSTNLVVPVWWAFGLFADAAILDGDGQFYYDYGIRVAFVTDFFEIYFPFANQDVNFLTQSNYLRSVRFVLDIDQGNIINRLRRGYY